MNVAQSRISILNGSQHRVDRGYDPEVPATMDVHACVHFSSAFYHATGKKFSVFRTIVGSVLLMSYVLWRHESQKLSYMRVSVI